MTFDDFLTSLTPLPQPLRVLEVGVRRWDSARPTTHRERVLAAYPDAEHLGLDIQEGQDVDVVGDAHRLHEQFSPEHFDACICVSTLEHLLRPWVFAISLAQVVKPGGLAWIATHQSFPLHGYPNDYFRFSTEALGVLFDTTIGWEMQWSGYARPARVIPLDNSVHQEGHWNFEAPAWLDVAACVRRTGA